MRTRLIVLAAFLLLLGLGGVAGVYFYDDSHSDQIAEGVKVNGVPIGGMTPAQAEKKLSATLLAPLDRPVKVRYKDRTFTLSQKAASIGIDIRGSVDKALKRSQEGDMFTRTWRNVRNKSLDTELAAEVSYNQPAIRKLVKRVQKSLDEKPVDAKVDLSKGFIDESGSKTGLRVKFNTLAKEVEQTLLDPGNTETVKVKTTVVQPKTSTKDLAKKYPAVLFVDRAVLQADALQEPQEGQDVRDRRRPGRHGHAGRALQHPEQGREPGLARPELRLGGRPRGQGDRRR